MAGCLGICSLDSLPGTPVITDTYLVTYLNMSVVLHLSAKRSFTSLVEPAMPTCSVP